MAYMITDGSSSQTTIEKFLGLNLNETGDTQLELGEASKMKNFRITKNYKLTKMCGYKEKYTVSSGGKIRAQWIGKLGENEVHVYVADGKVYNKGTQIGTITDDITSIFEFDKKLYFINGHEYKSWNGSTFATVDGYIPLIKIATTPSGIGTDYEQINVLTGKKHQTFSATGDDTVFYLAEKSLTSIDKVLVNGVETSVTKSTTKGTITFSTAPSQGVDNIDVYWTKGSGQREIITKNHYFQKYGLANDTRVFLYGNSEAKNRTCFSALGNGIASAEYFPRN